MYRDKVISTMMFLICLTFLLNPSFALTRQDGVDRFLQDTRTSISGYSPTISGEITIKATTEALEISTLLGLPVNNTLGILLHYQDSQNSDGGFHNQTSKSSNWQVTYYAALGLQYLGLNSTRISNWGIFEYTNSTATSLLYNNVTVGNSSKLEIKPLSTSIMKSWYEYIKMNILLGRLPTIPFQELSNSLKALQYKNGSYLNFQTAIWSNLVLNSLNVKPRDALAVGEYIRAFQNSTTGGFSNKINGSETLQSSYLALLALSSLNQLKSLDHKKELTTFIINLQEPRSGFKDTTSQKVNMEDTWYAIQSLLLLNKLTELSAPEVLLTQGFVPYQILGISGIFIIPIFKKIRKIKSSNYL